MEESNYTKVKFFLLRRGKVHNWNVPDFGEQLFEIALRRVLSLQCLKLFFVPIAAKADYNVKSFAITCTIPNEQTAFSQRSSFMFKWPKIEYHWMCNRGTYNNHSAIFCRLPSNYTEASKTLRICQTANSLNRTFKSNTQYPFLF